MPKKFEIKNSTAEFLIFQIESKEQGIEVMYADETIWCTQDAIAALFDKGRSTITEHLQNAFNTGELVKESVCRKFRRTASDGKQYNTQYYNLDAVISVGYRVNSIRATQFRQWATSVLREYAIRGYVLDFAESRAKRHIPMTMEDWAKRIDAYLSSDERPLLDHAGCVTHEEAVLHAETEFEKYRIVQDHLFQSDFDKFMGELPSEEKE